MCSFALVHVRACVQACECGCRFATCLRRRTSPHLGNPACICCATHVHASESKQAGKPTPEPRLVCDALIRRHLLWAAWQPLLGPFRQAREQGQAGRQAHTQCVVFSLVGVGDALLGGLCLALGDAVRLRPGPVPPVPLNLLVRQRLVADILWCARASSTPHERQHDKGGASGC